MSRTVQNLIDQVTEDLHDTRATRRWSDSSIINFVNDGALEIMIALPESTSAVVDFTTVAGSRQLLAATSYRLLDVLHNGSIAAPGTSVRQVSLEELDSYTPAWRAATEDAAALEFAVGDTDPRGFYVIPPSVVSSTLTLLVSAYPTVMTATTDTLPIRDEYFTALQYYVCWRCLNQDFEFTENNRADTFYGKFTGALGMKHSSDGVAVPATGQIPERSK